MPQAELTTRWIISPRDPETESRLASSLGIPALASAVLVARGLSDPDAADRFLNPSVDQFHDPKLLPDFEPAVRAILGAKERGEPIFVHGDYDADGVTSAALFARFLGAIGCNVIVHVPHREREGYGIHIDAVHEAARAGAKLFLTCDCGATAHEQVARARELQMAVVVTDHHTLESGLPSADAVVNTHREDSRYPFDSLSGAGIVFKLCAGIASQLGHALDSYYRAYLDLAVLGTIADVMPLRDENRAIAALGLKAIVDSKKLGIQALLETAGLRQKAKSGLRASHVSFQLGPRLNAAGRIADAALALRLLLTRDFTEAKGLANEIEALNDRRKTEQDQLVEEAIEQVLRAGRQSDAAVFAFGRGWHPGVVGIVAGKLRERFNRPAFVATIDPETGNAKGSARSIPGYHLADAIRAHPGLLQGGGHAAAAGFSIEAGSMEAAFDALRCHAEATISPDDFVPTVSIDSEASSRELDLESALALDRLQPFGVGNPSPTLLVESVRIDEVVRTKNPDHPQVRLTLADGRTLRSPAFGMGVRLETFRGPADADIAVQPSLDDWNGSLRAQWILKDFRVR